MSVDSDSESTINWPYALFLSVVAHVIGLGAIFMCSDSSVKADEELVQSEDNAPKVAEKADVGPKVSNDDKVVKQPLPEPVTTTALTGSQQGTSSSSSLSPSSSPVAPAMRNQASSAANTVSPAEATSTAHSKTIVYEVKPGDNLTKIAQRHKCTVTEIAKLNKIKPNKILWVGLKLKIPAPVE